jgi:hypothetical protein
MRRLDLLSTLFPSQFIYTLCAEGIETPAENSDSYLETCGQSFTTDFFIKVRDLLLLVECDCDCGELMVCLVFTRWFFVHLMLSLNRRPSSAITRHHWVTPQRLVMMGMHDSLLNLNNTHSNSKG